MSPVITRLSIRRGGLRAKLFGALLTVGLGVLCSQMTCAEVTSSWNNDDDPQMKDGGSDGGDTMWRCFMGAVVAAANEADLLDRCTEAEHIDRASSIPPTKWDGKTLPFM